MYPTIEELCRGKDGDEVRRVLYNCSQRRIINRQNSNGWSDKRTMREAGSIPLCFIANRKHPLHGFFDIGMDRKERVKARARFYKMYPEFLHVDRF